MKMSYCYPSWFPVQSIPPVLVSIAMLMSVFLSVPTFASNYPGQPYAAIDSSKTTLSKELKWYDASKMTIEGKGYKDTSAAFTRLPSRARTLVTKPVWYLSHDSAGLAIRFLSDATTISAAWDSNSNLRHMARTGSCGLDLYIRRGGKWMYCGTGFPGDGQLAEAPVMRENLFGKNPPKGLNEYLLFLPTYSPVHKLYIGLNPEAKIVRPTDLPATELPIVFYGTSITQGGCSSRSGMCHTSILRRWLDRPVINLGFSGSGKCEPAMADLVGEIPASIYVIETVPNMTVKMIADRMPVFIKKLRKLRTTTPILMVESPNLPANTDTNAELKKVYAKLKQDGIQNLTYLEGDHQQDGGENATVDGVHPTDLGFFRMATAYRPVLESIMKSEETVPGGK